MTDDDWGTEDPPLEAYGRVTNPERYAPLHPFAERLLARLEREFDVAREEGDHLDLELIESLLHQPAQPMVRLTPAGGGAAPITIAFDSFPGLFVRLGHWFTESIPHCGCDACAEELESLQGELEFFASAVTSGAFSEMIRLPVFGAAWRGGAIRAADGSTRGRTRITRSEAKRLIAAAGGSEFRYAPWPRRALVR